MPRKTTSKKLISFKTSVGKFSRLFPKAIPPSSRAAVGLDTAGKLAWFLFDTKAFWELICRIDGRMFEKLSEKEYEAVSLGSLIDRLEERWPFSKKSKTGIRKEYERALADIRKGKVYPV